MDKSTSNTCLNCETSYVGKFCPECGQKQHTHRITAATIAHDIPHSVLHIDKGFFYTLMQLLKRPGPTLKDYVAGKRAKHYSPIGYLLIMSAASSLAANLHGSYLVKFHSDKYHRVAEDTGHTVAIFFRHYPALLFAVMIPVISLWSWLFNRQSKYNYWENFVINTYLIAQFNIFFIINYLLLMALGSSVGNLTPMLTAFFCYMMFAYARLFPMGNNTACQWAKRVPMYVLIVVTVLHSLTMTGYMTQWWYWF